MRSLTWKIFFGYLMIIVLFGSMIIYYGINKLKNVYYDNIFQEIENSNLTISPKLSEYLSKNQLDEIHNLITATGKNAGIDIIVFDLDSNVIGDSREFSNNNFSSKPKNSNRNTFDKISVSTNLSYNNKIIGILKSSKRTTDIVSLSFKIFDDFLFILLVLIVISAVLSYFISSKLIKPISELSKASSKVALGDFDFKVDFPGDDEIAQLSRNFNQMTVKLKDYFVLAEARQQQYLTLISSIQAAIAVINQDGRIILFNKSFELLCKSSDIKNKYFWEFIKSDEFLDLINLVSLEKQDTTKEIVIDENYYLCNANFIESKNEIVVLFNDITGIKQLENVKRDFVINVTHELRTPLTAIKGFIETIEDSNEEDTTVFIDIIKRNTERLINIVGDLLTISEIEDKSSQIKPQATEILPLFENIKKVFEPRIIAKNLEFRINIEQNIPKFMIDSFRIEQVLINLIDNAIKYTDNGFIALSAYMNNKQGIITIEDTGLGIPKEHHNRLFERFYTVDKSRSRKVGGTGLGLSIVKHIIQLHHGSIKLESTAGKGTKFIICLPFDSDNNKNLSNSTNVASNINNNK